MSARLVTGLLFAAILINMRIVECSIRNSDVGTSKSEKITSVHGRFLESIWNDVKDVQKILNGIYPGTNWCGVGDVAKNSNHFGTSEETDKCCKEHDGCNTFITARETKYNLTNKALYTVSGCDCDQTFLECMVRVANSDTVSERDKSTARDFGDIFFNRINPNCLVEDHPSVCTEYGWLGTCTAYNKDTSQPKVWQFANGPKFPSR